MKNPFDMNNEVQNEPKRCIIVLGSGRSGTSVITRVLNILGVSIGSHLVPPNKNNPKGYWEHRDIVSAHEQLIYELSSYWDDIRPLPENWWAGKNIERHRQKIIEILKNDFTDSTLWALKDPRMSRLLNLWHPIFSETHLHPLFIVMYRNPLDVSASLHKISGMSKEKSLLLWFLRTIESELETRNYPRLFVSYESFINDWKYTMEFVSRTFGIPWQRDIGAVVDKIDSFMEPQLAHHRHTEEDLALDMSIPQYVKDLYRCMKHVELKENPADDAGFSRVMENFETEMKSFMVQAFIDDVTSRQNNYKSSLENLKNRISAKESELAACSKTLKNIQGSILWRITKPARKIYNRRYGQKQKNR